MSEERKQVSLGFPGAGDVVSGLTAIATISFLLSVVYEHGFMAALGVGLASVPATLADYTQSALYWMPLTTTGTVTGIGIVLAFNSSLNAISSGTRRTAQRSIGRAVLRLSILIAAAMALPILYYLLFGDLVWIIVIGAVSAIWVVSWVGLKPPTHDVRHAVRVAVGVLPAIVIAVFAFGFFEASFRATSSVISVTISGPSGTESLRALRLYDRGVLYLRHGHVEFVQWDSVVALTSSGRVHRVNAYGPLRAPHQ